MSLKVSIINAKKKDKETNTKKCDSQQPWWAQNENKQIGTFFGGKNLLRQLFSGTWKLKKRKQAYALGLIYIYYGLMSWLFSSGIYFFPPLVSAIVTDKSKSNNHGLDKPLFADSNSNDLEENDEMLLLSDFGPSSFSYYQEEEDSEDEENDVQLWLDAIESIKEWQENKLLKDKLKKSHREKRDEEVVCYPNVGCFRDDGPFDYLDMLPSSPEEVGTLMMLFTRQNLEKAQFIEYHNVTSVFESNYNASLNTKIIIHGFGSSCNRVWAREMRLSFLAVEDVNVICVDWSAGAADPNYVRAAVNTRLVGKQVALLIEGINDFLGQSINGRTHIIGFSLGAHVAGFAGNHLKNLSRITGLDPAGPLFEGYDGKVRLDQSDANYVDVIHSNGESLIVGGFGTWEPIGHVDFYPNGGRAQRGCQHLLIGGLYDFIYSYNGNGTETYRYLCNHRRAYKFFTDSISPKCYFTAFPCDSYDKFEQGECFSCSNGKECGRLGYYSNQAKGRGSLYLLTRDEEPFCGTQYIVSVAFSGRRGPSQPLQTYGRLQLMLVDKNGINETFALTQDVDDLLTSGTKLEKLITVHPVIEPVSALLLYVAYDGWIYSGRLLWRVDKISLMEGRTGSHISHCKSSEAETVLRSGIPAEFKLLPGDCLVPLLGPDHPMFIGPKFPKKPLHPLGPDHFPPISGNEPLNALLPPPPPPPPTVPASSPSTTTQGTTDEFVMDTKIVQLVESGDSAGNSIQINDEVAPVSIPADNLKKTEYSVATDSAKPIEVWDNLAPSAIPDIASTQGPTQPGLKGHSSPWRQQQGPSTTTPKPESSLFWPGFLDFFSGSSNSEAKPTPRPMPMLTIPPVTETRPTIRQPLPMPPGQQIPPRKLIPQQKITLSTKTKNGTQHQHVTMHHLSSDEHLTILKVDEDSSEINETIDNSIADSNSVEDAQEDDHKSDYIVLHKLPNGEALNLENLETYSSMADVESGISGAKPDYHPRSLQPSIDYDISPLEELVMSERPLIEPEEYEPIPLDQLEDLEAMPNLDPHPVYIINPLKGDLSISGEIQPPTEDEVKEALEQANLELFKLNLTSQDSKREKKFIGGTIFDPTAIMNLTSSSLSSTPMPTAPPTTTSSPKDFFDTQTVVYDFNWTPIPKRPTFGPSPAPPNYRGTVKASDIEKLSELARVTLTDQTDLAKEVIRKNISNIKGNRPLINVQLLPSRLSAVLYHVSQKQRSLVGGSRQSSRQNKIAPAFQIDPTGLEQKYARSLDSTIRSGAQLRSGAPGYSRRNRSYPFRRFQSQLVADSPDPYKYIPLRGITTPSPRLWWQPLSIDIPLDYSRSAKTGDSSPKTTAGSTTMSNAETTTEIPQEDLSTSFSDDDYFLESTTMLIPVE